MKDKIKDLELKIEKANQHYWILDNPIIDDCEYDKLVEQLRKLDPDNPLINKIGSNELSGIKVKHSKPVLSLDKVYDLDELVEWMEYVARDNDEWFCFSSKYDGGCVVLENGRLITRGGGKEGIDITHLAPWINVRLSYEIGMNEGMMSAVVENVANGSLKLGRMTGELLVPKDRFDKLRNSYPAFASYKTPRNLATGFSALKPDSELLQILTHGGYTVPVCTWVFHRAHEERYQLKTILSQVGLLDNLIKKLRNYKNLPTDGIVCRLEDDAYAESLGYTKHHPRGAMAFKFGNDSYISTLRKIDWDVGNAAVTPVAEFDTVNIEGADISRATMHNAKFILDNKVTVGATVYIERRGDVIPKVVQVIPVNGAEPKLIDTCPSCGAHLTYEEPKLVCTNETCPGRIVNQILHGLKCLGINGIGPALCDRLVRELQLTNIMCFCLTVPDVALLKAKGFTAHEIHVITSELERVMQSGINDADLFASLCIPQASSSFAEKCIKAGIDLVTMDFINPNTATSIYKIPGINSTAVKNTEAFMREYAGDYVIYWNMFNHDRPVDADIRTKYCFTGALPHPRKELEQWVLDHGGYPVDNISRADYLVSASPASTSSKMKYARSHNIPVITFDELMKQLEK